MKKKTDKIKTETKLLTRYGNIRNRHGNIRNNKKSFFLYVPENGFICCSKEVGAMPTYNTKDILTFDSKKMAEYAKEFLMNIKFANNINIVATIN